MSGRSFGVESPDPAEVDGVEGVGGVVVVGDEVEEALVLVLRIQSKFGINLLCCPNKRGQRFHELKLRSVNLCPR